MKYVSMKGQKRNINKAKETRYVYFIELFLKPS